MPARIIPSFNTKDRTVARKGAEQDIFAPLWTSKNIDLTGKPGTFRLSQRVAEIFNSVDDDADLVLPSAFIRTNADATDRWWALTQPDGIGRSSCALFKSTSGAPTSAWAQDALSNTPADSVDNMVIFGSANGEDRLVVANQTGLDLLNSTTVANGWLTVDYWSGATGSGGLGQSALSANYFHCIHVFLNLLLVPNGNVVHTIDDAGVVVINRIVLPDEYEIIWIADDGKFSYLGTRHTRGGIGLIFIWDGTAETYNFYREGGGNQTHAGKSKKGIMYAMNDFGELVKFDGDQFSEVASLPSRQANRLWYDTATQTSIGTRTIVMRQNGIDIINSNIHVLMAGSLDSDHANPLPNMPGGIWEYDEEVGFYPKHHLSAWNGDTASGEDDEFGAAVILEAGALKNTNEEDSYKGILAGAYMYNGAGNAQFQIMSLCDPGLLSSQVVPIIGEHRGYFITTKIQGYQDFKSFWTRLKIAYKKLEDSNAGILIKYRTSNDVTLGPETQDSLYFEITWTGGNTFTINDADGSKLVAGQEVEILRGEGSGALPHISSVVNTSANNYTITIDETIIGMSGAATARVMNFKRLGSTMNSTFATSDQTLQDKLFTIAKRSKWIQLKVELRVGAGGNQNSPEIEELFLEFNPSTR